MVEVDVHASRDEYMVVIHDARLERTTDGKGYVKDTTLKELKKLDAGLGEQIPTLEEVIQLAKGKTRLVVELKVPGTEERVLQEIKENRLEDEAVITSFYHPVIRRVKELNPNAQAGVIIASRPIKPAQLALDAKANALFPKYTFVDQQMVLVAHKNNLAVYPWTVDTLSEINPLIKMGVDGIVTNKPDILKRPRP